MTNQFDKCPRCLSSWIKPTFFEKECLSCYNCKIEYWHSREAMCLLLICSILKPCDCLIYSLNEQTCY